MAYEEFAFLYDDYMQEADYQKQFDFAVNCFRKNGINRGIVLDLACGTGTLCEMFGSAGFEVIGVDSSEEMLSVAREKKMESGIDAIYLCREMQSLDMFGTVDACTCTMDSINHITNEVDVKKSFSLVSLFMNDGGIFVFDVNTPYKHSEILSNKTFVYDTDAGFCVWQNSFDEKSKTTKIDLTMFSRDEEEDDVYYRSDETFFEKAYELEDLKSWLSEAGFENIEIFDDYSDNALCETSQRATFVCKRKNRG